MRSNGRRACSGLGVLYVLLHSDGSLASKRAAAIPSQIHVRYRGRCTVRTLRQAPSSLHRRSGSRPLILSSPKARMTGRQLPSPSDHGLIIPAADSRQYGQRCALFEGRIDLTRRRAQMRTVAPPRTSAPPLDTSPAPARYTASLRRSNALLVSPTLISRSLLRENMSLPLPAKLPERADNGSRLLILPLSGAYLARPPGLIS